MCFQLPCIEEAAKTRKAGDLAYLVVSDLENVKCKLIEEEMVVLCCDTECSSTPVRTLFWISFTSWCSRPWHYICQLLSSPANLLTGSDRMCTCWVQPYCGWSQAGSEHCVPTRIRGMVGGFFIKQMNRLPVIVAFRKAGHVGKTIAFSLFILFLTLTPRHKHRLTDYV